VTTTTGVFSRGKRRAVPPYFLAFIIASVAFSAENAAAEDKLTHEIIAMYAAVGLSPPTAARMTVCREFVCRRRMELVFTARSAPLRNASLPAVGGSPAAERKTIQRAFVWFEHRVGRETGTSKRAAKADIMAFDAMHNFDYWDTTRNDTSLLLVLQKWGTLRHHTVGNPRYRGNNLVGQLPHNTAVKARGTKWVIDMWPTAYGQVPDVMPLTKWLEEKLPRLAGKNRKCRSRKRNRPR
jgi:hypothetical protein